MMTTTIDIKTRAQVLLNDQELDCHLILVPNFYASEKAREHLNFLKSLEYNVEPGMFGKSCLRKTRSFGSYNEASGKANQIVKYAYAKKVDRADPWIPQMKEIRDDVWKYWNDHQHQQKTLEANCNNKKRKRDEEDWEPNYGLINYYPSKKSGISWHSDSERQIKPCSPIFSITFGAQRYFAIRKKNSDVIIGKWILPHGSLLIMSGNMQKEYQHAVLTSGPLQEEGERFNITFRSMY